MEKRAARMLYFEPNFVDEALVLLDRFGNSAALLAGGTRLGPRLRNSASALADAAPQNAALINLKRVHEMQGIARVDGALRIGATVTAAQLIESPAIKADAPLLAEAAKSLGSRQLRTVATIGGNVCSGDPVSDLTAALLACEARCEIASLPDPAVLVGLDQLVSKPGPAVNFGELLTAFEIPIGSKARFSYQKIMTRRAFELALVAVAVMAHMRGETVERASIALAGAAPAPKRAAAAEEALCGRTLEHVTIRAAARRAAQADAQPVDDLRASAAYRRHLVFVLTARALEALLRDAGGRQ